MSADPVLYVVTASDAYYPGSGTEDWKHCGPDEATAREAFAAGRDEDFCSLVALWPDGRYEIIDGDQDERYS